MDIDLVSHLKGRTYIWSVREYVAENTWTRVICSNIMMKKTA